MFVLPRQRSKAGGGGEGFPPRGSLPRERFCPLGEFECIDSGKSPSPSGEDNLGLGAKERSEDTVDAGTTDTDGSFFMKLKVLKCTAYSHRQLENLATRGFFLIYSALRHGEP